MDWKALSVICVFILIVLFFGEPGWWEQITRGLSQITNGLFSG